MIYAQLLGGAGFLLLVLATQIGSRREFLIADFCGLVPVVAHYILLDARAGAAMSALYMVIDVTATIDDRPTLSRRIFLGHYGLAAVLVAVTWRGSADLFALFGTLAAILSRQQERMRPLLLLIVVSCVGWGLYGFLAGSVSQVAFSTVYAAFSLLGVRREAVGARREAGRQTHA